MRPSSSSPSSSSIPPSSVSFFERYEKMFHCGGCSVEDEPVAAMYQTSSYEADEQQSTLTTEAISNWASYKKARRDQESPPVVTVTTYTQASYDEIDKFDTDERKSKRKSKTAQAQVQPKEAVANDDEYFHRIKKLPMVIPASPTTMLTPQQRRIQASQIIQMALPASPTTTIMTQQQQRREPQQCHHVTPVQSNKTVTVPPTSTSTKPSSPKMSKPLSSPPKIRLQYDMFQVVMPRSFRSSLRGNYLQYHIDSDSTQSTQSLSESEDDILWGPEDEEEQQPQEQQQDTPVSIFRRKVKLGTMIDINPTDKNNRRLRVRFEKGTVFPNPNEIPSSSIRKHVVPRMSPKQKQEYQLHNYQPSTVQRRQLELSSVLMTALLLFLVLLLFFYRNTSTS